ncbi:hypothetical protein ABT264_35080 [Streptomyces virginiae]|uniref:hypothetical protein n=1 Tax=Streptomyces virginiae TaxID=1961 RepID=UPI00332377D7
MSAWDWAVVIAIGALLIAAADCCRNSEYRDAWQESTSTSDRDRQIAAEQAAFDRIIAAEFPADIPHQTRRTEDNQ